MLQTSDLRNFKSHGNPRGPRATYVCSDLADERYDLLKLGGTELGRDVINAAHMEQQNGRDNSFRYALSSGPAHINWMKDNSKAICHSR